MENDSHCSSYEAAMEALSSLITKQKRGDGSPKRGDKHQFMETYLKILDLEDSLDGFNIIHVAGTKGKGSTCSFSEAILRSCGFSTGLFTSPHLIDVRERYRINGYDISEEKFLEYFWYCWHKLKENTSDKLPMPPLFQFLTLLAFRIFSCEKVDVAIVEVGLGGRLDSTNVIKKPVVCGIASLGMDHTEILGNTLGKIASEKAGIFKAHVPAFTVPQPAEAMSVLQERASALGISLQVAQPLDPVQLANVKLGLAGDHQYTNAGLAVSLCRSWLQHMGQLQKLHLTSDGDATLPRAILEGLAATKLNGRAQVVHESTVRNSSEMTESNHGDLIFYLDGAHSPESMDVCARWFSHAVRDDQTATPDVKEKKEDSTLAHPKKIDKQVLLFNCMETRDPAVLLPHLVNTCASYGVHFSRALFVPSLSTYSKVGSATSSVPYRASRDLSWQLNVQKIWENAFRGKGSEQEVKPEEYPVIHQQETPPPHELLYGVPIAQHVPDGKAVPSSTVFSSLPLTINWLRECVKQNPSLRLRVLVTGSLHLVGDVLKLLRR